MLCCCRIVALYIIVAVSLGELGLGGWGVGRIREDRQVSSCESGSNQFFHEPQLIFCYGEVYHRIGICPAVVRVF